jgi:hypothetical protein
MTHTDLINVGAKWLNKDAPNILYKSQFVATEIACSGSAEIPDILGLRPQGNILIEVKISVADFKRDSAKKCRNPETLQLGLKRFYLAPEGLISLDLIPEKWGLLEWDGRQIVIKKHSEEFKEDMKAINFVYYSILRRTNKPQIFDFKGSRKTLTT